MHGIFQYVILQKKNRLLYIKPSSENRRKLFSSEGRMRFASNKQCKKSLFFSQFIGNFIKFQWFKHHVKNVFLFNSFERNYKRIVESYQNALKIINRPNNVYALSKVHSVCRKPSSL